MPDAAPVPMSAAPRLKMSPEAFAEWELRQETRHEYHRGEIFPRLRGEPDGMAGGTEPHARIISNAHFELRLVLRDRGCFVYTDALSVRVEAEDLFTYPDLSVVCGEPQFFDPAKTQLLNPTVLVEVLPTSRASRGQTTKWRFYRQVPSLQAYLMVSQDRPAVDFYVLEGGTWRVGSDQDGRVEIAPLGVALDLEVVYDGVELPDPASFDRPVPR